MQLRDEATDWEFIVKLSVLVEASVTRTLVSVSQNDLMEDHFDSLTQSSRLRLCKSLGVLSDVEVKILEALSSVRNRFVHRIDNLFKTLHEFVDALPNQRKVELANSLLIRDVSGRVKESDDLDWIGRSFRVLIFDAVALSLAVLSNKETSAETRRLELKIMRLNAKKGVSLKEFFQVAPVGWRGLSDSREVMMRDGVMAMKDDDAKG